MLDRVITIGADPEVFLQNIKDKKIVSAENLIGGTKENPKSIGRKGFGIQEDNILAEYTIPPAKTKKEFVEYINFMLKYINNKINSLNLEISSVASAYPDEKYLQTEQALRFGCEPDYNVYLKAINPSPSPNAKIRTAGGHIHIGYLNDKEQLNVEDVENIVIMMDALLGVQSVLMDKDKERRILYGKAGSFRFKDEYGLEYRSLSNFWIFSEEKIKWVYDNTILATHIALYNKDILQKTLQYSDKIKTCINNSDEILAKEIVNNLLENIYILKENNNIKTN